MRESLGGKPTGAMKVKPLVSRAICDPVALGWPAQHSPVPIACDGAAEERMG